MSYVNVDVLLDFVSSLAVLGLLVIGFSALAPRLKSGWLGAPTLGVLFGLVVAMQMSMPLSPTEGVIVDMRQVPIVLAGAFLSARGLATCLGIAIATRLGIGGAGVLPGIVGMTIAGAVGYAWALWSPRLPARDATKLVLLGLLVNLHMLSAFLAAPQIIVWYFTEAAPTIFALNLACTPAIGWLLSRERELMSTQERLVAAAHADPTTRLLSPEPFSREVFHFSASTAQRDIAGLVVLTLKNADWLSRTWGKDAIDQALGALRVRLCDTCGDNRPLGIDGARRILVPVTADEMQDLRPFRRALRIAAADEPVLIDGSVPVSLSIMVESLRLRDLRGPDSVLQDIRQSANARRSGARRGAADRNVSRKDADVRAPKGVGRAALNRMFDQADRRMKQAAMRA